MLGDRVMHRDRGWSGIRTPPNRDPEGLGRGQEYVWDNEDINRKLAILV